MNGSSNSLCKFKIFTFSRKPLDNMPEPLKTFQIPSHQSIAILLLRNLQIIVFLISIWGDLKDHFVRVHLENSRKIVNFEEVT